MSQKSVQSARDIIAKALERSTNTCFTCSFQAEDVAILDLLRSFRFTAKATPVSAVSLALPSPP